MVKRNNGVDLFRLVGAFFIILVHTDYYNLNNALSENIRISARWALPYFFICSGYFLYEKIKNPLILRIFLETYHNRPLPKKGKKKLHIWM